MIQTLVDPRERSTSGGVALLDQAHETNWAITMSIGVDSDVQRLFHALTVPEFLEAWIEMPGRTKDSWVAASQFKNGYQISHCFADRTAVRITGSFLFCHRRKMRLIWQKAADHIPIKSLIDFRLRGNFGSSILELRHTQLDSADEFLWHQQLWQGSFQKLAFLLRSA
jgi:hypothetical protein